MVDAIGGYVITKDSIPNDGVPSVGDTINMNGTPHTVTKVTGHYKIEKDEWQVILKLASHNGAEITADNPPEWVKMPSIHIPEDVWADLLMQNDGDREATRDAVKEAAADAVEDADE